MRGRSFKRARAAADACMELQVLADAAAHQGRTWRAAMYRWRAARFALLAMACAREVYGLCREQQLDMAVRVRVEDYLQ